MIVGGNLFTRGTHFIYSYYDKDGNFVVTADAIVTKSWTGSDTTYSESDVTWSSDSGSTILGKGLYRIAKDSVTFISWLQNLVPPKIRYDNTENVEIIGAPLRYPLKPVKNEQLPETNGVMKYTRPAGNTTMLYDVVNRTVEGRDSLMTKAGKFDCWIITSTERIKPLVKKAKPKERQVKEWYSPVYGIVKAEYRSGGVLEQVKVLTAIR